MWSKRSGNTVTVGLEGRLDVSNTSEVSGALRAAGAFERDADVVLDCGKLDYISSAGLRILKRCYMAMRRKGGTLKLKNVNKMVMEVFEVTGFAGLLQFI